MTATFVPDYSERRQVIFHEYIYLYILFFTFSSFSFALCPGPLYDGGSLVDKEFVKDKHIRDE